MKRSLQSAEVKASIAYTICSIIQKSITVLTLPIFTRIMTQEQYGLTAIYTSWKAIITILVTLNLQFGSFDRAMVRYEQDRDEYIASVNSLCTVLSIAFIMIYYLLGDIGKRIISLPDILVPVMVVECVMSCSTALWMGKKKYDFAYKQVVLVTILTSVLSIACSVFLVHVSQEKGIAKILGNAIIVGLFGAGFYCYSFTNSNWANNKEYWKYALSFNIPLIAYYLAQTIFNQSDRIMISNYCGADKAAIYSVGYSLAFLLNTILNSINSAYVPWLYRKMSADQGKENQQVSFLIAVIMACLLFLVILAAPEIVVIFAGAAYREAMWVVPPVAMSVLLLFYAQLFIDVEFFYEKKKHLVYATVGAAVANIALNAWLIPKYGYVAAAYTTLLSYILFATGNYFAYKQILREQARDGQLFCMKNLILLCVVFCIFSFLSLLFYEKIVLRCLFGAGIILMLYLFKGKILSAIWELRS